MNPILQLLEKRGLSPRGDLPERLVVDHVTEVSSQCRPGSLFVAIKGFKADGHQYVADAARRGASAALVSDVLHVVPTGLSLVRVSDTRAAAGPVAQFVAGNPSQKMDVVGVTGTNGKTTTVFLMEAIFKAAGRSPGIMGTVINRWAGMEMVANETTPSAPRIAELMAEMARDGADCVAFETSSHAIDQRRTDGIRYRAAALTNVTQDHLDYHRTMEEYAEVKMSLFSRMIAENPEAIAVVNVDDDTGKKLAARFAEKSRITYGIQTRHADLRAENVFTGDYGIEFQMNFRGQRQEIISPVHGHFNVMNILTASGLALAVGIDLPTIAEACRKFRGAPGRFEVIPGPPRVKVIVDYAHTPDALIKLLQNARHLTERRLVAVFGCGGDRDKTKRPLMGRAAAELADEVIVTNDNPRTEKAEDIAAQIIEGIEKANARAKGFQRILDRRAAIAAAIRNASEGDVVVIAGKGHEDYQIVGTTKSHFDDREVARQAVAEILQYIDTSPGIELNP